jgi:hypoxanthine phosphoribosyltransferase
MELEKITQINDLQFKPFIGNEKIQHRILEIANQINLDYKDKNPILLITLKGSIIFAADLIREINLDLQIETIIAKSYGAHIESLGNVEVIENKIDFVDRDIIIIEDIVDTGRTMIALIERLKTYNPGSIEICTLLFKPDKLESKLNIKYVGFEISPLFVVGYGLDYDEKGRNLKDIYIKYD